MSKNNVMMRFKAINQNIITLYLYFLVQRDSLYAVAFVWQMRYRCPLLKGTSFHPDLSQVSAGVCHLN